MKIYNKNFYEKQQDGSLISAKEIAPIIIELFNPKSIIDVGCGVGTWLSAFRDLGIKDFIGLDGHYVNKSLLKIPASNFLQFDLSSDFKLSRSFDVAICLEVAEHINKSNVNNFIDNLIKTSSVIVFSAAIPSQGGVFHVNEEWPQYWEDIFNKKGYVAVDCIRRKIWNNPKIKWWYKQNIFVFIKKDSVNNFSKIKEAEIGTSAMIHPELFNLFIDRKKVSLKKILESLSLLPYAIRNYLVKRKK